MDASFVQLSLTPIIIGVLASVACALPGNFLVLRRQALLGDAISHVTLPGIVAAFILTGQVATWPMMIGAGVAAVFAVLLIELIRRVGRVEPGAAMGVVFTTMFAAGVLMLERSRAGNVHLDVEHALYGSLESLVWLDASGWGSLVDAAALAGLPPELPRLALALMVIAALLAIFWRPLALATFDEAFAASVGVPVRAVAFGLAVCAAFAAVAAFSAVGSIIVIAMFICPAAAARLMTDRLGVQVALSASLASVAAVAGYVLAGYGPGWLGYQGSVSASGMIAVVSGAMLGLACLFGPRRRRASFGVP